MADPIGFNILSFLFFFSIFLLAGMCVLAILLYRRIKDLNQSRENLKLTIEATTDIVVLLDRHGRYVDIFSSDESQLLLSRDSLIGRSVADVLGEELGRRTIEGLQKVFANGEPGFLSYSLDIGGDTRWYEANIFKRDETVAVVAIHDITKLKSVEEESERQKQFTSSILDSLGDPVFMKDRSHRWTYGNQAFSRIFGSSSFNYLGQTDHDVFPKDVADKFWESDEITFTTMSDYEVEEKIVLPDGGERIILTKKTPMILPDGSQTLVGVIRDITERRQMERQLEEQRSRQVAASRLASLGEMAGGLAHEINNPLAIISGYASRVRDLVGSLPTANLDEQELKAHTRAIEIANRIEATTLRIATIVKGLRAISRDGSQDEKELVNAKDIIDETLGLCVEHFRNEGISLEFEVYEDLWVQCRRVQISQVVLNLLSNSFFAVSNQEKKLIRIMAKRTEDMFELAIEDSGPGVPLEVREKIFQPFFTTKPVGKGTGLGLSIAASLVRDHGGDILLDESAPVTRFVMRLPLATETKPSPQFTGMH